MEFTLYFLHVLVLHLLYAGPVLVFLILLIGSIGSIIGGIEGWSRSDALYHAFINATTVGYGDLSPMTRLYLMILPTFVISPLGFCDDASLEEMRQRCEEVRESKIAPMRKAAAESSPARFPPPMTRKLLRDSRVRPSRPQAPPQRASRVLARSHLPAFFRW